MGLLHNQISDVILAGFEDSIATILSEDGTLAAATNESNPLDVIKQLKKIRDQMAKLREEASKCEVRNFTFVSRYYLM
jgi:hypothetical protein